MGETWTKWSPKGLIPDRFELLQNWDGVRLRFIGEKVNVTIEYGPEFLSLRSCDESDRWETVARMLHENGKDFFNGWLTYQASDSEYIEWFTRETVGVIEPERVLHLVFVAGNDIVDVLSLDCPTVTVAARRADIDGVWE